MQEWICKKDVGLTGLRYSLAFLVSSTTPPSSFKNIL